MSGSRLMLDLDGDGPDWVDLCCDKAGGPCAGSPAHLGAHADAIALTDPVVLVVGGRGDVDLVEVAFDAARSGDQQSRGAGPGPEPVRGPGRELPAAADG